MQFRPSRSPCRFSKEGKKKKEWVVSSSKYSKIEKKKMWHAKYPIESIETIPEREKRQISPILFSLSSQLFEQEDVDNRRKDKYIRFFRRRREEGESQIYPLLGVLWNSWRRVEGKTSFLSVLLRDVARARSQAERRKKHSAWSPMFASKFEDKKNRKRKDCSYNNFVSNNSNGSIRQTQSENERERERERESVKTVFVSHCRPSFSWR